MIWGLQNSHALNPKHLLPFRLNTSMPHRKLSPYAPIPLNPQKPQAVFWTGLITRETPELFVTCRAPPKDSCHHLCCRVQSSGTSHLLQHVGRRESSKSRGLALPGGAHVQGRQAVPSCSSFFQTLFLKYMLL